MLNVSAIVGRLVAAPQLKHTPQGTSVVSFTVAVERSYCRPGEQRQADFIDCVAWRGTAEFVCKYFGKGSMIAVDGCLQTRTFQDKNGSNRKATEILASSVSFCGSKAAPADSTPAQAQPPAYTQGAADDFAVIDDNEDLPF